MGRRTQGAWIADVVAVGAAMVVVVSVGTQPFLGTASGSGTTPALRMTWAATTAAAALVAAAVLVRRPPQCTGAGLVAAVLVAPGLALHVGVAPWIKVVAIAISASLALVIATFVARLFEDRSRATRIGWAVLASATLVSVAAHALLRDPFREIRCAPYCLENPLLVTSAQGWVHATDRVLAVVTLGWCALTVASVARSKSSIWSRGGAALATVAATGVAVVELTTPGASMWSGASPTAAALAPAALSGSFALATVPHIQVWRTRLNARQLAAALAESVSRDGVANHLRLVVRHPSIRLLFPTGPEVYLDADGEPTVRNPTMATTTITRGEAQLALIEHDEAARARLGAALNPAVTIAVENERLRALAAAEVAELRASRRRIVERADDTRYRLERDLHDGAQQRLLLLGMELSRMATRVDDPGRERYRDAIGHTQLALAELRALVHEGRPPVLDELGLVEALRTLAETAPVPLVIETAGPAGRAPPAVERAVYGLARSMIADGHAAGASKVRVHLCERAGIFTVAVGHDASSEFDPIDAEDRVGAVGGAFDVVHGPTWTECTASFP